MKLIQSIVVASASAEWVQPTYNEVLATLTNGRSSGGWGHPVEKASAAWSLCSALAIPTGASEIICDQSTCAVLCPDGFLPTGKRRTKCRWTKKKGFFWKAELGACETCADLTAPSGTDQTCEFKNGKKKCTHKCATEGELFSLATATPASISIKCKCPKVDGVKTCGWLSGKLGGQVDQATLSGLTCAAAPTTAGPVTTTTATTASTDSATTTTTEPAVTTTASPEVTTTASTAETTTVVDDGYALSSADIEKFVCRGNSWQLPQSCGSDCSESDKTFLECEVSMTVDGEFLEFSSTGIPDHNLCSAPPNSAVIEGSYSYRIPRTPVKKAGDQSTFSATNMAAVGFALNGVPIYNPYDSSCCDAGLYELTALDLCYAHPNGVGGMYHYHVWSGCLAACTGASELIGIALDGYPIMGPGINPDTGFVWSQSDMDKCGGKDVDGKYAYYTTVDFPYYFQCYAGETSSTTKNGGSFTGSGNCALDNAGCDFSGGGTGPGGPGPGGPPRSARSASDPTQAWFDNLLHLQNMGHTSSYSQALVAKTTNSMRRRRDTGNANLESAIDTFILDTSSSISKETFLKHLSYSCDSCNGPRELLLNCNAEDENTCTNEITPFEF